MNQQTGLNRRRIPRVVDLPYWTSPPVQFVYESTATLSLGSYTWNDHPPRNLTRLRKLGDNDLYIFWGVTLSADISALDYEAALSTTPLFQAFLQSDALAPLYREPLVMNQFYSQFQHRLAWLSGQADDVLKCGFRGVLNQTANLIGKASITLKAVISAQEIVDEDYINLFKAKYPVTPGEVREI